MTVDFTFAVEAVVMIRAKFLIIGALEHMVNSDKHGVGDRNASAIFTTAG